VHSGRKSIRLQGYDYASPGAYFVTMCSYQRRTIFGDIVDDEFVPNHIGAIVIEEVLRSQQIRSELTIDEWVLMPNHLHAILWIETKQDCRSNRVGATGRSPLRDQQFLRGPAKKSLGSFVAGLKSASTKRINQIRHSPGTPVWQRNYYERIIRNERELARLRQYTHDNPLRWEYDRYHTL
jgi:putative transposase